MPSHMPSSFASAAAGQASNRDSRTGRGDGRGSGDWPRSSNRSVNGTLTLRRSSNATHAQSASQNDPPLPTPGADTDPAHQPSMLEQTSDTRYSMSQMMDILKSKQDSEAKKDVSQLFVNNWDPGHASASNGRGGWSKSSDGRDPHSPYVCWDANGEQHPISLAEKSELEKSLFADVNAPSKPTQNNSKDQGAPGTNGRKASMSHGSGNFGLSSPVASRPGTRRRETSDSITGLASPTGTGRFVRDEPSPFLTRKFTDWKDAPDDREDSKHNSPFSTLTRSNTSGVPSGNGHVNPWSATSMSPMGNFGSFALGGQPPTPTDKRPGFGSMRGESRLAHLMPKDTLKENDEGASRAGAERSWRSRPRTDTDPFSNENGPSGSAALGGGRDSPPLNLQRTAPGLDTPVRGASGDFGMSDAPGFRDNGRSYVHQTPQGHHNEHDRFSPSETNPYRSPPDERGDTDDTSYEGDTHQLGRLGGIPEHGSNAFGTLPRGFNPGVDGSDRSQTSSTGAAKGFPALQAMSSLSGSGFGSMGGWPTGQNTVGTPDRENRPGFPSAFGGSMFGAMGDLQSPGLGGLGGMFGQSSGNLTSTNSIGRGSKLGSLFPSAMQAQMQNSEMDSSLEGSDMRQSLTFGAIGKNTFPPSRDTESPMRTSRLAFEDIFPPADSSRTQGPFTTTDLSQGLTSTAFAGGAGQLSYQQSQDSESPSNQLPPAQQRTMVMPDRMRWVYLDPQGQVQGPFSGLEMHDWYKASFFSADLSVRKVEDTEFEPLGQLIRRIGNSREPFLVPQIGIPHGASMAPAGAPFTPAAATPGGAVQPGSVQPPFAGAFPSFGTTLTAEQQNNLERRKQEEQYLMARQREFLAQQQVNMKQMQMTGVPAALHHHSSAHSLQSQPSFGSMTSPIGMPPQPPMPGVAGFFDAAPRAPPAQGVLPTEFFREDELARLSFQERQQLAANVPISQPAQQFIEQSVDAQREAARAEQARQNDPQGFKARLHEFEQFRAQHEKEEAEHTAAAQLAEANSSVPHVHQEELVDHHKEAAPERRVPEELTLTQQVAKAASAKQSPVPAAEPVSPWGKVNPNLPTPFPPPPPQSTTPLPAPTAQRGRTNLPGALNVESRSSSGTPEVVAGPSLAPWAKETVETSKGPSLKEIQEAEAKKAAKAEEAATAARRLLHEQEIKALSIQPVAPAPGLPTSSTWGNNGSPATPTNGPSAWAKPSAAKIPVSGNLPTNKKTLADIQREEELRKQKQAAVATATLPTAGLSGGKRYADLASKPTAGPPIIGGTAWSTVGAGGKVKIPTGPAAAVPQALRSASSANIAVPASRSVTRPAQGTRSATTSGQTGLVTAQDEFTKWAKAALTKGLNSDINVDEFFRSLSGFPLEAGIIADSVYANSQLMDGRRFAEEYIRRRKLAEKGVVEPANTGSVTGFSTAGEKPASGWSEVAKKGPPKEEPTAGFKVVPNKKKGKK